MRKMNEFRFHCKSCNQLSDDGDIPNKLCMDCADELSEVERRALEDYYDKAENEKTDDLAAD
jgi:hypothetical protein